jgi:hypothetical protein
MHHNYTCIDAADRSMHAWQAQAVGEPAAALPLLRGQRLVSQACVNKLVN